MSDGGLSTSQVSAAGAYARAGGLVATLPVRPADPVRPRFQVKDQVAPDQAKSQVDAQFPEDRSGEAAVQGDSARGSRAGFGLLGAFTSFLARMFAQSEVDQAAAPMATGIRAYANSAASPAVADDGAEVFSPSFPRLSSGRALDLTV